MLSKSSMLYGMQCEKRLYWHVHARETEPAPDAAALALLEEGRMIEREAMKRFPMGVAIQTPSYHSTQALELTQAAIARGERTLFQAAFMHAGVFARVDILDCLPDGTWRLIEVKAGARIQRKHLPDVAIQYWVAQGAGLAVARCEVMYLNKECVAPALDDLFALKEVTPQLGDILKTLPALVNRFQRVLQSDQTPARDIGRHCRHPSSCIFEERCRKPANIPAISVFNIPKLDTRIKWDLYRRGHLYLDRLPALSLTSLQRRMIDSTLNKERFVNGKGIAKAIASWKEPFYTLDFETISPLIPLHDGLHPGDAFPFQFSVRALKDGAVTEQAYLHDDASDPRPALAQKLLAAIGPVGSIVTYNKTMEKTALMTLAATVPPEESARLRAIAARLVDALPIMRAHVYDAAFGGSFSLKDVAPALFGDALAYDRLSVGDGQAAQRAFLRLIDPETSAKEKAALREALLFYCGLDTQALARLTLWLFAQTV